MYVYLFEAKSIQNYLFQPEKLRDVISASERLDRLVDSKPDCTLAKIIASAELSADIIDADNKEPEIRFLRCNGGTFYCFSIKAEPLQKLRGLWTLTLSQLFPSLQYTDALVQAESLAEAINIGHETLASERNAPEAIYPIATSIIKRDPRVGFASVPMSELAARASVKSETIDLTTEQHRQAYQAFSLPENASLQHRFTPDEIIGKVKYPINFDKDFPFSKPANPNNKTVRDMALIHIDGNGLGMILLNLKESLSGESEEEYSRGFRKFSDAINKATVLAAKEATAKLYAGAVAESANAADSDLVLPMRPIISGGDNITLFCRADLAVDYAKTFCKAYQKHSKDELKPLFETYLKAAKISKYLTASGGILFHKPSHPFLHSQHLVEELCDEAKNLTKQAVKNSKETAGPAALAIYRVSDSTQSSLTDILTRRHQVKWENGQPLNFGQYAYFVDGCEYDQQRVISGRTFKELDDLIALSLSQSAPISMNKWRQMLTHISVKDYDETQRIFERSLMLCNDARKKIELFEIIGKLSNQNTKNSWYWPCDDGGFNTMISDVLTLEHYRPESSEATHD